MRPDVLMLGWEFPPYVNGGLGVACQGLGEALAKRVNLTMVVPRSAPRPDDDPLHVLPLDGRVIPAVTHTEQETLSETVRHFRLLMADVVLHGYEREERVQVPYEEVTEETVSHTLIREVVDTPARTFQVTELYGGDLGQRVTDYADLLLSMAADLRYDLIHAHDWMTWAAALQLKARSGCPVVLHVHSLEYDRGGPQSQGWIFEQERRALAEADLVISVSAYTARILREVYGVSPEKIYPVLNGVAPVRAYRTALPYPGKLVVYL
ncbi:MAG: hypothetical protein EAZ89_10085, partial [Bacteroidetes bacterium]